ncbi:MAG TPA: DNA-processing protein DprA [Alphaproteobacteria bacterium]
MLPLDERIARFRLARTKGVGPITFRRLIERYSSAVRAIEQLPELSKKGGRAKPLVACNMAETMAEIANLEAASASWLVWGDAEYPERLAVLEDAPCVLSVMGNVALLNKPQIAIVGSRNASLQGRKFAENVAQALGRAGYVVTSGLARGIDTAAHTASLNTGTIAVTAGGIDVIYPAENKDLHAQIAQNGAIVAENEFGVQPTNQHFPRRNRIISGLSMGVVIVEATLKSGSLITAHTAADQGREVFAVPGHPFDPRAAGPNSLIRDGANVVTSAEDILNVLARSPAIPLQVQEPANQSYQHEVAMPDEQILGKARDAIWPLLSSAPTNVDEIIRETRLPVPAVHTVLLEWELAGKVTRHPGNRVSACLSGEVVDNQRATI